MAWWLMPVILALRRPMEKNCCESEASLAYSVNKHGYSVSSVFHIVHSFKLHFCGFNIVMTVYL